MKLRQWQYECIKSALSKFQSGSKAFLVQATPGAGKTYMAAALSNELIRAAYFGVIRTLISV